MIHFAASLLNELRSACITAANIKQFTLCLQCDIFPHYFIFKLVCWINKNNQISTFLLCKHFWKRFLSTILKTRNAADHNPFKNKGLFAEHPLPHQFPPLSKTAQLCGQAGLRFAAKYRRVTSLISGAPFTSRTISNIQIAGPSQIITDFSLNSRITQESSVWRDAEFWPWSSSLIKSLLNKAFNRINLA